MDRFSCQEYEAVETPTHVTSEGLMSPYDQVPGKQDAAKTQRPQKRIRELENAAQASFAEEAPFKNRKQIPTESNNKTNVCKPTTSVVLRKVEDIGERAERAAEATIGGNGR